MPIPVSTMEDLSVNSKMAISNAMSDEEIKTLLLEYNYDDSRYNEGLELHKKAEELYKKQKKEYSEQYKASEELDKAYNEAKPVYREHVELKSFMQIPIIEQIIFAKLAEVKLIADEEIKSFFEDT